MHDAQAGTVYQPVHTGAPAGPFLQYGGVCGPDTLMYTVLVVLPPYMAAEPAISLTTEPWAAEHAAVDGAPVLLDTVCGYAFWRFRLTVRQDETRDIAVQYAVPALPPARFVVPAVLTQWRVAMYSCNGYSLDISKPRVDKYRRSSPLWSDILNECARGLHLMIGAMRASRVPTLYRNS